MKLVYKIIARISIALIVLMAAWAAAFYLIITDEINDETDDALEDYAQLLIIRTLAGEELPSQDNGTNNTYYIREVDAEYAGSTPPVSYSDEEVYIYVKQETEPARVLKMIFRSSDDRFFELTVAVPSFEKDDLRLKILIWIVILYLLLLLAVLVVNVWILNRSFRPLYALLDWFGDLKLGDEFPPLDNDTNVEEFRKLNEAVMQSARRNNEIYDEQRLFIGNAAHELQTPVAVCRNRLEILADDPLMEERQLDQISSALRTLDHMSKLNKTLLLLSRIENRQFPDSENVDINALLRRLVSDYKEVYGYRNMKVRINENGVFKARMNLELASVLFNNLFKNAFANTPDGGEIGVTISAHRVEIANTASTATPLEVGVIFRRFYQSEKREGSAGLGLSLVESVGRLYGLDISYRFDEGVHVFSVSFPR